MNGKIPSNYEESKQWIDVFNASHKDTIYAMCPCRLSSGYGVDGAIPIMRASPLQELERFRTETGYLFGDAYSRSVAVCGPVDIPPRKYGKVSQDWPLLAYADGEDKPISEIANRQVFANSTGFRTFQNRVSEAAFYWRVAQGFALLSYPETAKRGLCWVTKVENSYNSLFRLLSFRIEPMQSLSAGYSQLKFVPDQEQDFSVVEIVDDVFRFHSFGRYDLVLNFQLKGVGSLAPSATVPIGTLSFVGAIKRSEDLPVIVEGEGLIANRLTLTRAIPANIASITHTGPSYTSESAVMTFEQPVEHVSWNRSFGFYPRARGEILKGVYGRELIAEMTADISWSMDSGQNVDLSLSHGYGYIAMRSETNLI